MHSPPFRRELAEVGPRERCAQGGGRKGEGGGRALAALCVSRLGSLLAARCRLSVA